MADIEAAIVTAAVGLLSGLAGSVLGTFGKDRATRLNMLLDYTNKQINEFYAPLVALTSQLDTAAGALYQAKLGKPRERADAIEDIVIEAVFAPLHDKVMVILTERLHLVEGRTMPASFNAVISHLTALEARQRLRKRDIDTGSIKLPDWPWEFYGDVRFALDQAGVRQELLIREMKRLALPNYDRVALWSRNILLRAMLPVREKLDTLWSMFQHLGHDAVRHAAVPERPGARGATDASHSLVVPATLRVSGLYYEAFVRDIPDVIGRATSADGAIAELGKLLVASNCETRLRKAAQSPRPGPQDIGPGNSQVAVVVQVGGVSGTGIGPA